MQAALFNTLLILMPLLAAHIVTSAFNTEGFGDAPASEALIQTRSNIDDAFVALVPHNQDPRNYWADQIERELKENDLTAAQGYLLAAPQMLSREDVKAVEAAAKAQIIGDTDERLMQAALLFLRNDVRGLYEETLQPVRIDIEAAEEAAELDRLERADRGIIGINTPLAGDSPIRGDQPNDEAGAATDTAASNQQATPETFALLGDMEDLATHSREWLEEERGSLLLLRLEGISKSGVLQDEGTEKMTAQAASIIKSALRARRLNENYIRLLDQHAAQALPEKKLRRALEEALAGLVPMSVREIRVQKAFADSIDPAGLERLLDDLQQVYRISELTSPTGAISLLQYVKSTEDLHKARLLAEAGGKRAVALSKREKSKPLRLADSGFKITMMIALQCIALAGIVMTLLWVMISALRRSFKREKKPFLL